MMTTRQDEKRSPASVSLSWIVSALAISTIVVVGLMAHNRLTVDASSPAFDSVVFFFCLLTGVRFVTRSPRGLWQKRMHDFSESAAAMVLILVLGALGSYEAAADTSGFYDATLEHGDRLLHFNWIALYRVVAGHPLLQHAGAIAYGSIYLTPAILLAWLSWRGERVQSHRFLLTFWTAAALTLLIFPLLPARGALEFLWHGPIHYMPTNGLYQGEIIPALRHHAISSIDLGTVKGLVCAPSFHTACAIIFIATAWPHVILRRFMVPLNVAMLMATPVEGTHYLTDMLLGAAVAMTSIGIVRAIYARFNIERRQWSYALQRHPAVVRHSGDHD